MDFTDIDAKELDKLLLDDLCKIAEKTKSETMYVALSTSDLAARPMVRNMLVYGFEKATKEESEKFLTGSEILLMKLDINQEDDFMDLY